MAGKFTVKKIIMPYFKITGVGIIIFLIVSIVGYCAARWGYFYIASIISLAILGIMYGAYTADWVGEWNAERQNEARRRQKRAEQEEYERKIRIRQGLMFVKEREI